jgi:uncharacterized membrane protein YedE/YeeE
MKTVIVNLLMGALFGWLLSRAGVADFAHIHGMFAFTDFHMFLVLGTSVAVSLVGLRVLKGTRTLVGPAMALNQRLRKPGNYTGGLLFGVGWALTGACPGTSLVQLGTLHWGALLTIVGIAAGVLSFKSLNERYWKWPSDGCG